MDAFFLWTRGANLIGAAAAWRRVIYILSQVSLLLRVGYYDVGRVDLQGGNSRPPWKSPPGAAARLHQWEFGSSMLVKYLGFVCGLKLGRQFDWRLKCSWDGVVRVIDGTPGCDQDC